MAIVLDKRLALKTACVARQAERSVAFGLRTDSEWFLMCEYYHQIRLQPVLETIDILNALTEIANEPIARETVLHFGLLTVLRYPVTRLLNCFRDSWRFAAREIQFIVSALQSFTAYLHEADKPDPQRLVLLRMNLLTCHEIIGRRLAGVPEFDKAMHVEHYCQPDHLRSFTIDEVCEPVPLLAA